MAITFTTYKADLLVKLGLPSGDGLMTDAALGTILNSALRQITTQKDWPWLYFEDTFVTVADDESYSLATAATKTKWLSLEDDELDLVERAEIKRWDGDTGRPVAWAEAGDLIILGPTPDAVYTINRGSFKSETAMSTGSDTILLPDAYSDYLLSVAAKIGAVRLRDSELHGMMISEEREWLKRIADNARRSSRLPGIKTRQDWVLG